MAMVLKISDGTTEVDFSTNNYDLHLSGWAPKRAQRRQGLMGGAPYGDVIETMSIEVRGTTPANTLANLNTLSDLLDQAEAWRDNPDGVSAVYIQYAPNGSSLGTAPTAVIKGPPPGRDYFDLPPTFEFQLAEDRLGWMTDPITISFVRSGLWLGATEAKSSTTSTGNPTIRTISSTFTDDQAILTPYDAYIDFESSSVDTPPIGAEMYFCWTNSSDKLLLLEGEDANTTTGAPTTPAETKASGGNVLRWASITSGSATWNQALFSSYNSNIRTIQILTVVRITGSSVTADINFRFYENSANSYTTVTKTIDSDEQTSPIILPFEYTLPQAVSDLNSFVFELATETGATVDLDYLAVVGLDDSTHVIHVPHFQSVSTNGSRLHMQHRLDSHLDGYFYADDAGSGTKLHTAHDGNKILAATGNSISCLVLGRQVPGNNDEYVIYNSAELDAHINVTRTLAYLTPV